MSFRAAETTNTSIVRNADGTPVRQTIKKDGKIQSKTKQKVNTRIIQEQNRARTLNQQQRERVANIRTLNFGRAALEGGLAAQLSREQGRNKVQSFVNRVSPPVENPTFTFGGSFKSKTDNTRVSFSGRGRSDSQLETRLAAVPAPTRAEQGLVPFGSQTSQPQKQTSPKTKSTAPISQSNLVTLQRSDGKIIQVTPQTAKKLQSRGLVEGSTSSFELAPTSVERGRLRFSNSPVQNLQSTRDGINFPTLGVQRSESVGGKFGQGLFLGFVGEAESFADPFVQATGNQVNRDRNIAGPLAAEGVFGLAIETPIAAFSNLGNTQQVFQQNVGQSIDRNVNKITRAGSLVAQDPVFQAPTFVAPVATTIFPVGPVARTAGKAAGITSKFFRETFDDILNPTIKNTKQGQTQLRNQRLQGEPTLREGIDSSGIITGGPRRENVLPSATGRQLTRADDDLFTKPVDEVTLNPSTKKTTKARKSESPKLTSEEQQLRSDQRFRQFFGNVEKQGKTNRQKQQQTQLIERIEPDFREQGPSLVNPIRDFTIKSPRKNPKKTPGNSGGKRPAGVFGVAAAGSSVAGLTFLGGQEFQSTDQPFGDRTAFAEDQALDVGNSNQVLENPITLQDTPQRQGQAQRERQSFRSSQRFRPALPSEQVPRSRQSAIFAPFFQNPRTAALGIPEAPTVRTAGGGNDNPFAFESGVDFFRVFDVSTTPFGRVAISTGVQQQSITPNFEIRRRGKAKGKGKGRRGDNLQERFFDL